MVNVCLLQPFLHNRNSLLPIIVSVSMLITFLSNEWVGQEVVKWLWPVCVCLCVLTCVKLYLCIASSSCIRVQHLCIWLFTLCTVCSDDALLSFSVAAFLFWQIQYSEDAFLMCVWLFTLGITTNEPSHLRLFFLSLPLDNGWSIRLNHPENIKLFRQNFASGNDVQKPTVIISFLGLSFLWIGVEDADKTRLWCDDARCMSFQHTSLQVKSKEKRKISAGLQ